jgi:hypothetical protein
MFLKTRQHGAWWIKINESTEKGDGGPAGTGPPNTKMTQTFNPNNHLIQIKNKQGSADYLPVAWRLVWFRSLCPEGLIETEIVHLDLDKETEEEAFVWNAETRRNEKVIKTDRGLAIVRATVRDGKGGVATGTKMEKAASFGDWLEKAETGAIGRALAALGYGTQFTDDELDELPRIVDAPVERKAAPSANGQSQAEQTQPTEGQPDAPATEQQIEAINKLRQRLGQEMLEGISLTYMQAKKMIQQLSAQYREAQNKQSSGK